MFGIDLMASGSQAGTAPSAHRHSRGGPSTSRSTAVTSGSWTCKHPCEYYQVLPGPPGQARVRPWVIESVYLFDSLRLIPQLQQLGIKIGVATSVRKQYWEASRIFPSRQGSPLDLTDDQIAALRLFSAS